jgi:chorismate synthase
MNTVGQNVKVTFFGESHGKYLGVVIDQLAAGIKIDLDLVRFNLSKIRPNSDLSTKRIEKDEFQIISGFLNGYTTGAALTVLIPNTNTKSADYDNLAYIPRPSHADYPAYKKYSGFNDLSGSGIFSGRVTALWMIVGSIAQQILESKNIFVASHIKSINEVFDDCFDKNNIDVNLCKSLNKAVFPLIDNNVFKSMESLILETSAMSDSVGGTIESAIINLEPGIGEPLFLSVESHLSSLLFSIPAVKAIEFGEGFNLANMYGSTANDQYQIENNEVKFLSNNNGGILGGLTTSRPVVLSLAIKPTSSIYQKQKSIDLKNMKNVDLEIVGRHDPQIVSRVIHVVNAVLNFAILDLLLFKYNRDWLK